jgi:hypothetical protein
MTVDIDRQKTAVTITVDQVRSPPITALRYAPIQHHLAPSQRLRIILEVRPQFRSIRQPPKLYLKTANSQNFRWMQ